MEKRSSRIKRSIKRKKIVWIGAAAVLFLSASLAYAAFQPGEDPSTPSPAKNEKPVVESKAKEEATVEKFAEATDEELTDQIHYYNEISLSKEEIQSNHPATKIVNQKAKEQNVEADLDNPRYRDIVKEAALDLEGKTPEEQEALVDFAKKADQYENKETNKRIKELKDKAKKEGLTEKERAELISLLPIKNPGPKLKPDPKDKGDKNSSTPPEEKVKSPGKGDNGQKDQQGKSKGDEQDNKWKDKNKGDKWDDKWKDKNKGDKWDDKWKDKNKGDKWGDKWKDKNKGDEQDGKQEDENNEDQQDGSSNEEDGDGQDNGDDGQDNDSEEPEPPLKTEANGYDRSKAVEYAYKWWNKRNNDEYGYYSRSMGGCYDCWYDCTNFVSQVIKSGGIKERDGRYDWLDHWFYNDEKPSLTWGVAHSFYKHMKVVRQAQNATQPSELKVGDIISVDFEGDGDIDHSVVITRLNNGQIYATYHSSDNKDKNITLWLLNHNVYAWKMETVKNN